MNRGRTLVGLSIAILAMLAAYSAYLACHRIYQVDEFQNVYMARVQATGEFKTFFTTSSLFLFGPLSWLASSHLSAVGMITGARIVFLGLFWFNVLLTARLAGGPLISRFGLAALIGAATLAPLWDYGFEVRHDNVILAGILLVWWLVRARPPRMYSYLLAGTVTVGLLFTAEKALVYVVPLSVAIIAFPPPGGPTRGKAAGACVAGAALTVAVVRLCYGTDGAWQNYLSAVQSVSRFMSDSGSSGKFSAWGTLARFSNETPLLLAVAVAALAALGIDLRRRKQAALGWDGLLPEALLFLGALVALIINPTPFPYNLVNVVPFAFILAFKYAAETGRNLHVSEQLAVFFLALLFFGHFTPFALLTSRHLRYTNARQRQLMGLAEQMTDPSNDLVYDGIGMVPTRRSATFYWYLHSLNSELLAKPGSRVRDFLALRPAAVLVRSYRTDWLPDADDKFIESRYVHLADDFEVLGTIMPAGGGWFEIVHAGRYRVVPLSTLYSDALPADSITGVLDGLSLPNQPARLAVGKHELHLLGNARAAVVWLGPTLNKVPRLSPADHRLLFQNWY